MYIHNRSRGVLSQGIGLNSTTQSMTVKEWLASLKFKYCSGAIMEYGYDSFKAFDAATEEDVTEMCLDDVINMRKTYGKMLIGAGKKR